MLNIVYLIIVLWCFAQFKLSLKWINKSYLSKMLSEISFRHFSQVETRCWIAANWNKQRALECLNSLKNNDQQLITYMKNDSDNSSNLCLRVQQQQERQARVTANQLHQVTATWSNKPEWLPISYIKWQQHGITSQSDYRPATSSDSNME